MFRHCVMFSWKPEVTSGHLAEVSAGLDGLGQMEVIRSFRHGPDAGVREGNYDYAVVADFDDQAGWEIYQADEGHQQLIAELLAPYIADRAAVQFAIPD
jgi:hypothetical protein